MKRISINWKWVATGLLLAGVATLVVLSPDAFMNLVHSVISLLAALVRYFYAIATGDIAGRFNNAPLPFDLIDFGQFLAPISSDMRAAKGFFFSGLRILWDWKFLEYEWSLFSSWLSVAARFVLLLTFFLPLLWLWLSGYLKKNKAAPGTRSKQLKAYDRLKEKVITPTIEWLKGWFGFMMGKRWVIPSIVLAVAFSFNLWSFVIDFFSYYLNFSVAWSGAVLFKGLVSGGVLLWKLISFLGEFWLSVIAYFVFDAIRCRIATKKEYEFHEKNKTFIETKLGQSVILSGPPGTGKTMTNCSISRTREEMNREGLWKVMDFFWTGFPKFPWTTFYDFVFDKIGDKTFQNTAQIDDFIERKEKACLTGTGDYPELLWGYRYSDPRKGHFYDELHNYPIFEALRSCAEAFFLYQSPDALLQSDYTVQSYLKYEKGASIPKISYKIYEIDYRHAEDVKKIAVHLDFNEFRLVAPISCDRDPKTGDFYKFDPKDIPSVAVVEGLVYSSTEINKNYGNKNDDGCNSRLRDGFATALSVFRHFMTINNTPFGFFIADSQKVSDTAIKITSRFENELVIAEKDRKYKTTLFLWVYTRWVAEMLIKLHKTFHDRYVRARKDDTLFMTLWDEINTPIFTWYIRRRNRWWYIKERVINIHHTSETTKDSEDMMYYIIPKGDYADNYATDMLRKRLNKIKGSKKRSWTDAGKFKGLYTEKADDDMIHSYMGGFLGDENLEDPDDIEKGCRAVSPADDSVKQLVNKIVDSIIK